MDCESIKVYKYSDYVLVTDIEGDNEEYRVLKKIDGLCIQIIITNNCTINLKIFPDKSADKKGYIYSEKEWTLERLYDLCRHWFEIFPRSRIIKLPTRKPLFDKKELTKEQEDVLYIPPPMIYIYNHNIEIENVHREEIETLSKILHYCFFEVKNHPLYSEYCDINVKIDSRVPNTILSHQCEMSFIRNNIKCKGCINNTDILKNHVLKAIVILLKKTPWIHYM